MFSLLAGNFFPQQDNTLLFDSVWTSSRGQGSPAGEASIVVGLIVILAAYRVTGLLRSRCVGGERHRVELELIGLDHQPRIDDADRLRIKGYRPVRYCYRDHHPVLHSTGQQLFAGDLLPSWPTRTRSPMSP